MTKPLTTSPPGNSTATQPLKPLTTQEALRQLENHAVQLIQAEPEKNWLSLMRNQAAELGLELDVKDPDLQRYLDDAERGLDPAKVYYGGQKLEATESVFMLDGMVKLGEANVVVGQPKVGKSSFTTGLIAALRDRRESFLGRDLLLPNERMPTLIFGTDQSEGDWLHFLRRESLVDDAQTLRADSIDFFCSMESGEQYNFTREGIKAMRAEIEKHQFPLVIIDSLSSMMEPTGIEENTSRYAQPIRSAIASLRKTGATLIIIHHSVKRPNSWDWITECRGSSSISSVFSWGVLMRWVAQEEDGLMRTDKRVGFTGKGRGSGEAGGVMAEYLPEGGWVYLDGLESAQQVERVRQRIMELGGFRASVFDYISQRTEIGADVSADEVATELNKQRTNVRRELGTLKAKGLVEAVRFQETGGRPRPFWKLSAAAQEVILPGGHTFESFDSKSLKINKINVFNSQDSTAVPENDELKIMPLGSPVELLRNGAWQNGWLVHEHTGTTLTAVKTGDPMTRISNLRPDLDVRLCSNPYRAEDAEADPAPEF